MNRPAFDTAVQIVARELCREPHVVNKGDPIPWDMIRPHVRQAYENKARMIVGAVLAAVMEETACLEQIRPPSS